MYQSLCVIQIIGASNRSYAHIGDVVVAVILIRFYSIRVILFV
jgi:ribosomal protein L14